jgi:hemolysin activation/secretion protein
MLLVKEMPGCAIPTVTIAPGAVPETSDFDVKVNAAGRINGYIMGDNQGSRYTGRNRLYGGIDINSPFRSADKFSLSAMTSEYEGLQNIRASYGFPLAYNGLRAELAASRATYELGGIYSELDATGSADIFEGTISYPVKRSHAESIDLFLNLAYKDLEDDLEEVDSENPRHAAVATLTLQRAKYGTLFNRNFFAVVAGSVNLGDLVIENREQRTLNKAGADTDGTFSKLNLNFSGDLALTEKLSARGSLKLQKVLTGNNLDSTEQLFITGPGGVRVYDVSYGFDNGYLLNGELRYALPEVFGFKHAVGLFADNGWVCAEDGDYTDKDDFMLSDAGLGYYAGFKQLFGSVHLVHSLGSSRGVDDPGTRILVQGGISF